MINKRLKCKLDGCNNLAMKRGKKKNEGYYYDKLCTKHHRLKFGMKIRMKDKDPWMKKLCKTSCERCGWNKSYCDLHRIVMGKDGGKYEIENIIVLCPNCHRIEHLGNKE